MKQGEIWYANLNPSEGSEQAGLPPVVIISGNLLNSHLSVVIACPLTTQIKNYKGNVVVQPNEINRLEKPSEILTFHVRSISKNRLIKRVGAISQQELKAIKLCLNEILTY